ncbi:MAG: phospholipase/carboxylesterase [Verrucomicrobia bacterium]|nr:phospholipase/carboxylesterase [Verrucomicrobiota bacterium]
MTGNMLNLIGHTPFWLCALAAAAMPSTPDAAFSVVPSETYTYLLYRPPGYPHAGGVPLMIFLHGKGDNSVDGAQHWGPPERVAHGINFPFLLVTPICSDEWWDGAKLQALVREIITSYQVDPDRVYLTGISMGGFATWDLAIREPELFAAIVPICGGGGPTRVACLRHLPVWVYHGAKDPIVSEDHSARMVAALRAAGGDVDYTVFPEERHICWPRVYNDRTRQAAGYPERFAQLALGHNSKAVHRVYSRNAKVTLPPLEDYEKDAAAAQIIPLPLPATG